MHSFDSDFIYDDLLLLKHHIDLSLSQHEFNCGLSRDSYPYGGVVHTNLVNASKGANRLLRFFDRGVKE